MVCVRVRMCVCVCFFPLRLTVGAGVLRASSGTCVWGLEARLLLPDASLLHERGGAEPGESFNVSTRVHMVAHIALFHHRNSEFDASVTYLFDCREKREDKIYLLFLGRFLFCFAFFLFLFFKWYAYTWTEITVRNIRKCSRHLFILSKCCWVK